MVRVPFEDGAEEEIVLLGVRSDLVAPDVFELFRYEDVAPFRDEAIRPDLIAEKRYGLEHLGLADGRQHNLGRLQLTGDLAGHLDPHHSAAAEDQDRLGGGFSQPAPPRPAGGPSAP